MSNILVIAAHPDDEVLGCGGTIARHTMSGDNVYVLFMTNGVSARGNDKSAVMNRKYSAQKASDILGIKSLTFFDYPDNQMDSVPLLGIVKDIEKVVSNIHPRVIYTHHIGDLNVDHSVTHRAVMTACRPQPGCEVREIYSFEVLSSTEWSITSAETVFMPNLYYDINSVLNKKVEAFKAYEEEIRFFPHSRSVQGLKSLALYRGSSVGMESAEAFQILRLLKD
jgi:N-acetylglucosamine malate deacetylase 1